MLESIKRLSLAVIVLSLTSSARAATITVTDDGDAVAVDSMVTLREAIVSINAGADVNGDVTGTRSGIYGATDQIRFLIGAGPITISPTFPLPVLATKMTIDGTTQPGYETAAIITIDGAAAGSQSNGLVIVSTTDSSIQAIRVLNFGGVGILIVTGSEDVTPPAANPQSVGTTVGVAIDIQLTASDPDDATFTFAIGTNPAHGTISGFNAATGTLTYTPAPAYIGSDAFTFTASDTVHTSTPATVSIEVVNTTPAGLIATAATPTRVDISWTAVPGATSYEIDRRSPGVAFAPIASSPANSYSDESAEPGTAYLYRARSVIAGAASGNSNPDLATTVFFTDPALLAGTLVKAIHLQQLRTAIHAVRALAGLSPATVTDSASAGTSIKAIHFAELRLALDEARAALSLSAGGYSDASLEGVVIKAVHVQELRARVQ